MTQKLLAHHKKFKILIAPSSEHEGLYDDVEFLHEALEVYEINEKAGGIYSFDTKAELDAFIEGYNSAIGYCGDGYFITNILN